MLTAEPIMWRHSLDEAQEEAAPTNKLVLIELFSPKCFSCQNMAERTFTDERMLRLLEEDFVPLHFDVLHEPEHLKEFMAHWTPTVIFQCPNGNEHRRSVGFLPPEKFVAEMALAHLAYAMNREEFDEAHHRAQHAVELSQDDEHRHAEALYWQAVAAYKASGDQNKLVAGWKDLLARFPNADWAARVDFIRDM